MKTILYVHHVSDVGGGSYCLLNILKEIDMKLYRPIVLLKKEGPLSIEIKKLNIPVYFMETLATVPYNVSLFRLGSIKGLFSILLSIKPFARLLDELQPDLIHLNNMMLYPYLRIAKKKGVKTLIHVREHWELGEHQTQRNMAIDYIDKYSDKVIAINEYSASMVRNGNVEIIYDWIDFCGRDKYLSVSELLQEDAKNLRVYLFTGGLQPIKGTLEIITLFSKYCNSANDRLLMLGVDMQRISDKHDSCVRKILSRMGYKFYVYKVLDALKKDRRIKCVPATYQIKHIMKQSYCLVSYFTKPHANLALAESIILQVPAIAADTPEAVEYSGGGKLAILFDMNSEEDFVCKLKMLQTYRNSLLEILEKNSCQVEHLFSKQQNVQRLCNVYSEILS